MLLKLARNVDQETNKGLGVRGKHLILSNAAHPAVFGGGVLGGFGAKELMTKLVPVENTVAQRFVNYSGRAIGAGLGAGLGAVAIKSFQKPKEQK